MFESMFDLFSENPIYAILICLGVAFVLSLATSLAYLAFKRKNGTVTRGFPITLVVLPMVCTILVSIVNIRAGELASSALGVGLVLGGIFALTRFRSDPLNVEDMTYIILASTIGISTGLGYVAYSVIGTVLVLVIIVVLSFTRFGEASQRAKKLRILVPEDLNYEEEFASILGGYCDKMVLDKVKTVDFGQLFELSYAITLKKDCDQKRMIDEIRVKNGNLQVVLTSRE